MSRLLILGANGAAPNWAARARHLGHDVAVLSGDAAPFEAAFAEAAAAMPALYDVALPDLGDFQMLGDAGEGPLADWVIDARASGSPGHDLPDNAERLSLLPQEGWAVLSGVDPAWLCPMVAPGPSHAFCAKLGLEIGDPAVFAGLAKAAGQDRGALIAALRALKARAAPGIGSALAAHEARIAPQPPADLTTPPVTLARQVPPDWVDYNGHMNEARYLTAFSDATDRLLLWAGMDAACVAQGHSVFTVETHIRHLGEVDIGDRITVTTQILDGAGKRLHLWHELRNGAALAATGEQLLLHVDLNSRRVGPPRADVGRYLSGAGAAQAHLPHPEGLGRHVGQARD